MVRAKKLLSRSCGELGSRKGMVNRERELKWEGWPYHYKSMEIINVVDEEMRRNEERLKKKKKRKSKSLQRGKGAGIWMKPTTLSFLGWNIMFVIRNHYSDISRHFISSIKAHSFQIQGKCSLARSGYQRIGQTGKLRNMIHWSCARRSWRIVTQLNEWGRVVGKIKIGLAYL